MSSSDVRRVGIVFSGGPAPAANAVISAAVTSFLEDNREVVGIFHGYSHLQDYGDGVSTLIADKHYRLLQDADVRGMRNTRGILIGTSRSTPGKFIRSSEDLLDPQKTKPLRNTYDALCALGVDALISIGGDGTLRTANLLVEFQKSLKKKQKRVRVIHLPKTIDNDYEGIDFTFGFFTAVDVMAQQIQNLGADAMATSSYFIVETMGRKTGWLSYGVAIAGDATLVIAAEDVTDDLLVVEKRHGQDVKKLNLAALTERLVDVIVEREKHGKHFGTIVLAEGLGDLLPEELLRNAPRDESGEVSLGKVELGRLVAKRVADRYEERTGRRKKVTGIQVGYTSRSSLPHAFDVMLASQLGIGAYRALVEEGLDGHMVSVRGQLELHYVKFASLIDSKTLQSHVRYIARGSDFHRLARFLEARAAGDTRAWVPGRRNE